MPWRTVACCVLLASAMIAVASCDLTAPYRSGPATPSATPADAVGADRDGSDGPWQAADGGGGEAPGPTSVAVSLRDDGTCGSFHSDSMRITLYDASGLLAADSGCFELNAPSSLADAQLVVPDPVFADVRAGTFRVEVVSFDGFTCHAMSSQGEPGIDGCGAASITLPSSQPAAVQMHCLDKVDKVSIAAACLALR